MDLGNKKQITTEEFQEFINAPTGPKVDKYLNEHL
tara:strand:- start:1787 stop:1891 length:105 start_codon:yes stop_codon:yes gene_type:complete